MSGTAGHVGLDLGSTFTKVAISAGEGCVLPFDPEDDGPIATAVAWTESRVVAGRAAFDLAAHDGLTQDGAALTGFLSLLGTPDARWAQCGWRSRRSPAQAARGFLTAILDGPVARHVPTVSQLVVTVPERWLWTPEGRRTRAELCGLLTDEIGLPVRALVSAPVCAAAWVVAGHGAGHEALPVGGSAGPTGPAPRPGRLLLVCDVGGDMVQVALCETDERSVRLLDAETRSGGAGLAFATAAVRLAHTRVHGREPTPAVTGTLLRAFAGGLSHGQERAVQVLAAAAKQPRWRDACAYRFGAGYRLSAEDVTGCFELVEATIEDAVTGLLTRRADLLGGAPGASDAPSGPRHGSGGSPSASGDDLDVVTVGGLGVLPPAQAAVMRAAGRALAALGRNDDLALLTVDRPDLAAARGAALLAAGRVNVLEGYPHALNLRVHHICDGLLTTADLVVATAGAFPLERAEADDVPIVVTVDGSHRREVLVDIQVNGHGDHIPVRIPLRDDLSPGGYHVGVQVARTGFGALVLRPVAGGQAQVLLLPENM